MRYAGVLPFVAFPMFILLNLKLQNIPLIRSRIRSEFKKTFVVVVVVVVVEVVLIDYFSL